MSSSVNSLKPKFAFRMINTFSGVSSASAACRTKSSSAPVKRVFDFHGRSIVADPGASSLGYLCVAYPASLNATVRKQLHSLAAVAGLESESSGPKSNRRMRFGWALDCGSAAELVLQAGDSELTPEHVLIILKANFGLSELTEEDIT